jgi:transposase InsO family protein
VSELTGDAVRLTSGGAARTVSVTALLDALHEPAEAPADEGSARWDIPSVVLVDLYDRCITGLRLRPAAARSPDVASVLFQTVTPQKWGWAARSPEGPYAGLPDGIVLGDPGGVLPDTIVVDHGKIYLSEHTRSVCERLGISIQPAIPGKPTDKAALERFLPHPTPVAARAPARLQRPRRHARGDNAEAEAFYYVAELEQLIREWVGRVYHTPPTPAWSTRCSRGRRCRRRRC